MFLSRLVRTLRSIPFAALTLALMLAFAVPAALEAQVGSSTDIITGHVRGEGGRPLEGARVEVTSVETQVVRTKLTNASGQYTVVFPDGGGQYVVVVRFLGMAPQTIRVTRQADEDRLVADASLSTVPTTLAAVTVRANRGDNPNRPTPGEQQRIFTPDQLARLPVDASDLNALAALTPGVVSVEGTDTTAAGFSVAGQAPTGNQVTLDGLSFGAASVPQEAVRATRVITSTYDVARGQYTGGEVASTTRGGTNVVQGAASYALREPSLEFNEGDYTAFGQRYTQNQLSAGFGGPIVHNRLFGFGAIQARRRSDEIPSLIAADPTTLGRLGVQPDSAARFLSTLHALGLSPTSPLVPDLRLADNASALARMDWLISEGQSLMLRGDWRYTNQGATRIGPLSVPNTGGQAKSSGGGGMIALTSHFESGIINELRAYVTGDRRSADPYQSLPEGRVRVTSLLEDGTVGVAVLGFGGNAGLPQAGTSGYGELTDEISWLSPGGAHRVKLGGLLNDSRYSQNATTNLAGTFSYNSLEAFAANRPATFTRSSGTELRDGGALSGAVYLGDTWRNASSLQLTYGARIEASSYSGAPTANAQVDSVFGLHTGVFPGEVRVSPRVGFSWILPGTGLTASIPRAMIRGGFGEFRGRAASGLFTAAQSATGAASAETQLVCVDSAAPTPDWATYAADPASIPTSCSGSGPSTALGGSQRAVAAFDPHFAAPLSWRASLGGQRRLFERFNLSLDANYARGRHLPGAVDVNLDTTPKFRLADEGGRPVYSNRIAPNGIVTSLGSRRDSVFGQVLELGSGLQSDTRQVTLALSGLTTRGLIFQSSYTYTRSRDQSPFTCCSASQAFGSPTTAGNPNEPAWARADLERRHAFLVTATYPVKPWVELTAIGRTSSGAPFTPIVGSDINGDGARNDRAFIFDPATTRDTSVANGIARLLATAPRRVRECLQAQMNAIAGRNSCTGQWQPALDMQANFRPNVLGLDRRLMLSLQAVNTLTGLDQLLHGANNLRGWGQPGRPDPTLLYVRRFDPATSSFVYQVNERFGSGASRNAFRAPFQLALQGRYVVGPDRARDRIQGLFGGGRGGGFAGGGGGFGGGGAGGAGGGDPMARLARAMPNPASQIIEIRDSLGLDSSQVARLRLVADSLSGKTDALIAAVRAAVANAGANPDPASLFATLRPRLAEARANTQQALRSAQSILTPQQWAKVPDSIKNPATRPGGPGGGGLP